MPGSDPSGVCPMLHKSGLPSVRRDLRFPHCLDSWVYPILPETAILPHPLLLHPPGAEHKPSSLSLPQQVTSSSPPIIFTALCWAHSSSSQPSCAGAPQPEAVLQTWYNECWVEGNNHFPLPTDYVWAVSPKFHHIQRKSRLQFSA